MNTQDLRPGLLSAVPAGLSSGPTGSHRTPKSLPSPSLNSRKTSEMWATHRSAAGTDSRGELSSPGKQTIPELPGGNCVPALVGGGVQHVDTPGVHMLGHLEDSIEFVVQGRFASRSRQRIVTRSQSNLVCTHNEYWYTSARARRKCANLTITRPRRGQRASPLERTPGYPRGEARSWPPAGDRYLQQNRWQIGQGPGLPK
jgi:hypothetical protein